MFSIFFIFTKNPFLSEKNSQKPKIIGFFEKVEKIACFLHLKHPISDLLV